MDAVIELVALLEAAKYRDRVIHRRLVHVDGLEPARERGIVFDVLLVVFEGRRADNADFAARERGLQHVRGVHRALGSPGAHERVYLVYE